MMWDDNCTLWTAAALYNHEFKPVPPFTASTVADRTGAMLGPARDVEQIRDMFGKLNLGRDYEPFDNLRAAEAFMMRRPSGTHFAFGYTEADGGHMIVAITSLGSIAYYDHQIREQNTSPLVPLNVDPPVDKTGYIVFVPAMEQHANDFSTLRI